MKLIVIQLGARMHYAVPRLLASAGMLEKFYTDILSNNQIKRLSRTLPNGMIPGSFKRLAGRVPFGVPEKLIRTFPLFGIEYYFKKIISKNLSEMTATHLWAGKRFNELVIKNGFGNASGIYCFNSAALEVLKAAKSKGLFCILEQTISPQLNELILKEHSRWAGWEESPENDRNMNEFVKREREEWNVADLIVCGSEFVLNGIKKKKGPVEKCVVVPYGVERNISKKKENNVNEKNEPLRLLTVGAVGLRKGAPYLYELSKLNPKVKFSWAGQIDINNKQRKVIEKNIELLGIVPRNEIDKQYSSTDALILLSVCEGSATVIYESLSRGIPVICTENSGAPKLKAEGLYIVPNGKLSEVDEIIKMLEGLKKKGKLPIVQKSLMDYVSYKSYSRRLISALKNKVKLRTENDENEKKSYR